MLLATIPQRQNVFECLFRKSLNTFPKLIHAYLVRNNKGAFVQLYDNAEEVSGVPVCYLGVYTAEESSIPLILEDAKEFYI